MCLSGVSRLQSDSGLETPDLYDQLGSAVESYIRSETVRKPLRCPGKQGIGFR